MYTRCGDFHSRCRKEYGASLETINIGLFIDKTKSAVAVRT